MKTWYFDVLLQYSMVGHESVPGELKQLEEEDDYNYDFAIIKKNKKKQGKIKLNVEHLGSD